MWVCEAISCLRDDIGTLRTEVKEKMEKEWKGRKARGKQVKQDDDARAGWNDACGCTASGGDIG